MREKCSCSLTVYSFHTDKDDWQCLTQKKTLESFAFVINLALPVFYSWRITVSWKEISTGFTKNNSTVQYNISIKNSLWFVSQSDF